MLRSSVDIFAEVIEFVDGQNLQEYIKKMKDNGQQLTPEFARSIINQVIQGIKLVLVKSKFMNFQRFTRGLLTQRY